MVVVQNIAPRQVSGLARASAKSFHPGSSETATRKMAAKLRDCRSPSGCSLAGSATVVRRSQLNSEDHQPHTHTHSAHRRIPAGRAAYTGRWWDHTTGASCSASPLRSCFVTCCAAQESVGSQVTGWNHWPGKRAFVVAVPAMLRRARRVASFAARPRTRPASRSAGGTPARPPGFLRLSGIERSTQTSGSRAAALVRVREG
jgi:hypothetical protein